MAACISLLLAAAVPAIAQTRMPEFRMTGLPADVTPIEGDRGPQRLIVPQVGSPQVIFVETDGRERTERTEMWTSTVNMTLTHGCTGTLIGPRVLLTAAHCVERFDQISIAIDQEVAKPKISGHCQVHPQYRATGLARFLDYALCYLSEPVPSGLTVIGSDKHGKWAKLKIERLSLDPRHLRMRFDNPRSRLLVLAGYGCSSKSSQKIDHKLRAGVARIVQVAVNRLTIGSPVHGTSAILCPGDSGGPAFRITEKDAYGARVVVGVNSANILSRNVSFVSPTSSPAFVAFLNSWRARWGNPKICGLDEELGDLCHD